MCMHRAVQRPDTCPPFGRERGTGSPLGWDILPWPFPWGIAARNAGLTPFQGFLASLLNNASAGEYAGFTMIAAHATYMEIAVVTLIANARYLLMSCSLSQKFSSGTPLFHRLIVGFDVTDELFGIAIARPGWLDPFYMYGAMLVAMPCWAGGTALGVVMGNLLPARLVSALSVALYGMVLGGHRAAGAAQQGGGRADCGELCAEPDFRLCAGVFLPFRRYAHHCAHGCAVFRGGAALSREYGECGGGNPWRVMCICTSPSWRG